MRVADITTRYPNMQVRRLLQIYLVCSDVYTPRFHSCLLSPGGSHISDEVIAREEQPSLTGCCIAVNFCC